MFNNLKLEYPNFPIAYLAKLAFHVKDLVHGNMSIGDPQTYDLLLPKAIKLLEGFNSTLD